MKKTLLIALTLTLIISSNVFAKEQSVLKFEDISKAIDNNIALKKYDVGYDKLSITYDNLSETMKLLVDMDIQRNFLKELDFVFTPDDKPRTVYYMYLGRGIPVYMNHTLDKYEKEAIMEALHIPVRLEDRQKTQSKMELTKTYQPEKLLSTLNLMNKNRQVVRNSLELGAKQLYYAAILAQEGIDLQKQTVEINKLQLDYGGQKYEQGLISKNDLDNLKLVYDQAVLRLNSKIRSKDNLISSLNKLLSVPLNTKYDCFEGEITYTPYQKLDVQDLINKALQNRYDILSAKEGARLKTLQFDIIKKDYPDDSYEKYRAALREKELEELKLNKAIDDIKAEITKAVETIEQNAVKVKKAEIAYNSMKLRYGAAKQRFDNGLITQDILNLSQMQVNALEISLKAAINTYNMSCEKLKYATGIGPGFN